jgi:hypothetical protein
MALELLLYGERHRAIHDVESLAYVLMFICSHLVGPRNSIRNPPLYGKDSMFHPSPIKEWLTATRLSPLGIQKYGHTIGHLDEFILPHFSPYFDQLKPHVVAMWNVIFPSRLHGIPAGKKGVQSDATFGDIINVFKTALLDKTLIEEARISPTVLGKRSLPSDLAAAENGWDVAKVSKSQLEAEPKMNRVVKRSSKLLLKSQSRRLL